MPFWGRRFLLACTRRVEPLKREPIRNRPNVLVVIDPVVENHLPPNGMTRLDDFLKDAKSQSLCNFEIVRTSASLRKTVKWFRPRIFYFLCHCERGTLKIGQDVIPPHELNYILNGQSNLDGSSEDPWQSLAFLNSCSTALEGPSGSYIETLHEHEFSGVIATVEAVIDHFAHDCGLDFLRQFLRGGRSVGAILHEIHCRESPLGLCYGGYCPPELMIEGLSDRPTPVPLDSAPDEGWPSKGTVLELGRARRERPLPSVPKKDEAYRSLSPYRREDRYLFVGREQDCCPILQGSRRDRHAGARPSR